MPFHLPRTIQGKFTLYLSTLVIVIMSGLSYWTITREKGLMENAIVREGTAIVESLAISCTNTMLYEDVGLVDESGLLDNYISDLMKRRDIPIRYAMILDPRGEVITHSTTVEIGNLYDDSYTLRALSAKETLLQRPSSSLLDISAPLAISTKRWGTLRIGISLEESRNEITRLIWRYVFYTVGFILIVIAAIGVLFGLITRPLKSLSLEMDLQMLQNDPPAPSETRQDEIGTLQHSFYRMLQGIKADKEERERAQKALFMTEKMVAIGKLTSGLAHEINNPLGGILNCVYHFKKGGQSAQQRREYLDLMEEGVRRIQRRVTNLLEYARNPSLEMSMIDLRSLLERTLALLDYQIRNNRIRVALRIPEGLPPVPMDKDQVGQVLVNLLLNAIQAMPEEGLLGIDARISDGQMVIGISNTGAEIPEENLPKVFDPFFTTKSDGEGTGLGLWLSQRIIEQHGGTIRIANLKNEGVLVTIAVPMRAKGAL
ncbi:MAG: ATP-binding protein [Thermodesulfobacteriota bacterium]